MSHGVGLSAIFGALVALCATAAVLFLRFYKVSRDRFFLWFAAAFGVFSLTWALRVFFPDYREHSELAYVPRLIGFLMLVTAIIQKNRETR